MRLEKKKTNQPNTPAYAVAGCSSEQCLEGPVQHRLPGRRNVLSLLLVWTEMQVLGSKKKGRKRDLGEMWVKYKRLLLFVVFYVMGRNNTVPGKSRPQPVVAATKSLS